MTHIRLTAPIHFQNVLLATDFSEAAVAAVGHAAAIARTFQGIVDVVHVIVPEVYWWAPPESLRSIEDGIRLWAEQEMKDVLASERLLSAMSAATRAIVALLASAADRATATWARAASQAACAARTSYLAALTAACALRT